MITGDFLESLKEIEVLLYGQLYSISIDLEIFDYFLSGEKKLLTFEAERTFYTLPFVLSVRSVRPVRTETIFLQPCTREK